MSLDQVFHETSTYKCKVLSIFFIFFLGYVFPKKLGLDSKNPSWDLKNRIPRRKLRIQSYSQVCRSNSKSKYLKIAFPKTLAKNPVWGVVLNIRK